MTSDRDQRRHEFRVALFRRRGIPSEEAVILADQVQQRDRELDSRRMCLECKYLTQSFGCFPSTRGWMKNAARAYRPDIRQPVRCEHFAFATP